MCGPPGIASVSRMGVALLCRPRIGDAGRLMQTHWQNTQITHLTVLFPKEETSTNTPGLLGHLRELR